jgi:hypothetical protein
MRTSDHNEAVLDRLRGSVASFVAGELELEDILAALQSAVDLLENDGTGVANTVRLAEADVEEIRFTRLLDEQRPAAIFRLDELFAALPSHCDE